MQKSDVIAVVAERSGMAQAKVRAVIDAYCATVIDALVNGDSVTMTGFGTFESSMSTRTDYVNPVTKEKVHKEPKLQPKFRFAREVKRVVGGE